MGGGRGQRGALSSPQHPVEVLQHVSEPLLDLLDDGAADGAAVRRIGAALKRAEELN